MTGGGLEEEQVQSVAVEEGCGVALQMPCFAWELPEHIAGTGLEERPGHLRANMCGALWHNQRKTIPMARHSLLSKQSTKPQLRFAHMCGGCHYAASLRWKIFSDPWLLPGFCLSWMSCPCKCTVRGLDFTRINFHAFVKPLFVKLCRPLVKWTDAVKQDASPRDGKGAKRLRTEGV